MRKTEYALYTMNGQCVYDCPECGRTEIWAGYPCPCQQSPEWKIAEKLIEKGRFDIPGGWTTYRHNFGRGMSGEVILRTEDLKFVEEDLVEVISWEEFLRRIAGCSFYIFCILGVEDEFTGESDMEKWYQVFHQRVNL